MLYGIWTAWKNHVYIICVDELRHFEIKLPRIQLAPWRNELNCSE